MWGRGRWWRWWCYLLIEDIKEWIAHVAIREVIILYSRV
tara:strand:- start:2777 stop:2893 length:117 start_codon:yes stop_codon:yes gene_type:complete